MKKLIAINSCERPLIEEVRQFVIQYAKARNEEEARNAGWIPGLPYY